ncbi:MAG: hypothetical protein IH623_25900 [Verrucomicrobia bacterium]|nr:hypothetical protein [Verrucomicrobiota bacterium]
MKTFVPKLVGLAGILLMTAMVSAQNYSLDWFTLDSGGGRSTGGEFAVSGAILQPEADPMTGGNFSLTGEFLSLIAAIAPVDESTTIFDNRSGSSSGVSIGNPSTMLANKFCLGPQSYSLDSVTLFLNTREPNNPPVVWLDIYSHDPATGRPVASTGVIMNLSGATNPITFKLVASSYETPIKWVPATPFILSANTCYWAVLTVESGEILYAASYFMPTGAAAAYGRNQSQDGGVTWGPTDETTNRKMLILGTPSAASPPLAISFTSTNTAIISWPFPSTGFALQQNSDLNPTNWTALLESVTNDGTNHFILVNPPTGNRFYRLLKPSVNP